MKYRVVLATGRFGDWLHIEADSEDAARKVARRRTRRPISHIQPIRTAVGWAEHDRERGVKKRRRR